MSLTGSTEAGKKLLRASAQTMTRLSLELGGHAPVLIFADADLEPTVLADVPADALCMREETFAPVAPVCSFDSEEEVIAQANNTRYGPAASFSPAT